MRVWESPIRTQDNCRKPPRLSKGLCKLNPDLPRVPILLAFVYMSSGRYADAVPLLRRIIRTEREVEMRLVVGQRLVECLFTMGGEEEALEVVGKLRAPEAR